LVEDLNGIINNINYENCYDMVVKFFGLTSTLEDNLSEISGLPMKGKKVFRIKSAAREKAEADRSFFIETVRNAGRDLCGRNRTKPGEQVTKHNVYFGDTDGIWTFPVAKFEELKDDDYVQSKIRWQIMNFVRCYEDSFKLDWLC
jgi:hypothetical protein